MFANPEIINYYRVARARASFSVLEIQSVPHLAENLFIEFTRRPIVSIFARLYADTAT